MFFHLTEAQWKVLTEVADPKKKNYFFGQEGKALDSLIRRGFVCLIHKGKPWDGYEITPAGKHLIEALKQLVNLKDFAAPKPPRKYRGVPTAASLTIPPRYGK